MKIVPYITVPDARKTIEVYKGLFGATLVDPMQFTKEVGQGFGFPDDFDYENSTMHASIDIDGSLRSCWTMSQGSRWRRSGPR